MRWSIIKTVTELSLVLNAPIIILPLINWKSQLGPQLAFKIPHSPIHFSQYLPKDSSLSSSFAFTIVFPCEVEAEINSLPPTKALGLYFCPVRILKDACQVLSKPLVILRNKSVQSGIYPSKLKHAKIIPVFKNEDESHPSNYHFCRFLTVSLGNLFISD